MVQVLLHKGSDELQYGEGGLPCFSLRMARLQQWLCARPGIRVVDPFGSTAKVSHVAAATRAKACWHCAGMQKPPATH
jgi:hypothetical protein